jgi:siroheme synthase (precorrin-2 oxidase/ferrochelatase)
VFIPFTPCNRVDVINIVEDPEYCTFIVPSVMKRTNLRTVGSLEIAAFAGRPEELRRRVRDELNRFASLKQRDKAL